MDTVPLDPPPRSSFLLAVDGPLPSSARTAENTICKK